MTLSNSSRSNELFASYIASSELGCCTLRTGESTCMPEEDDRDAEDVLEDAPRMETEAGVDGGGVTAS